MCAEAAWQGWLSECKWRKNRMKNLELKAKQVKMFCFFLLFKRIFSNFVAYVKLKRVK